MKMPFGGKSSSTGIADETLRLDSLCAGFKVGMKHMRVLGRPNIWHPYKSTFFKYLNTYVEEGLNTAEEKHRTKTTGSRALPILLRSKHSSAVPNSWTPFSKSETLKLT